MGNSKELFIKAFMEAEQISNAQFFDKNLDITFSDSFEKKMNKLLEKDKRIRLSTRKNIRKGLLAAIVAIIVTFTGLISVSATRTPFIEFVKKIFPQLNGITLSEESTPPVDKMETEYTLTDLPEGFEVKEYQKDELGVLTVWKNQNDIEIVLMQNLLDSNFSFDTEHTYEELYINKYKAYYYASQLTWTDGVYWFTLGITNGEKNELIKLSKNISEKNYSGCPLLGYIFYSNNHCVCQQYSAILE